MTRQSDIVLENVSKFYGDVLGVNGITLTIPPGVTSLVGANGAGKTTLMNLLTGLIRPTRGRLSVLGISTDQPEQLFRAVGYCSHHDVFPPGVTGRSFIETWLSLHGFDRHEADRLAREAIERVSLSEAADRRVAGYSKGMRQRMRLALALSHRPRVLVLDEPLNGLDPLARADAMALFRGLGREGLHVVLSSHILNEVDVVSDRVILLSHGYVVADGQIHGVRREVTDQPMQMLVRCTEPKRLAAKLFERTEVVEVKLHPDGHGLLVRTRDLESFYAVIQRLSAEGELAIESVTPADDDALALYQYLIGAEA